MQDLENNDSRDMQNTPDSADENGCTYHTGRIPREDDAPAANGQPRDEANSAPSPDDYGTNGYARPYSQNQYPGGQQNRQYGVNGQPPMGNAYPYAGGAAPSGGDGGSEKKRKGKSPRSAGMIVLIVLLCVTVLAAAAGIVNMFLPEKSGADVAGNASGQENDDTNSSANTAEGLTDPDGPSIDLAQTPQIQDAAAGNSGALSSQQVYKAINESSVGILLYSTSTKQLASEGSGVIIGEDAGKKYTYIVTCAHVINASDVTYKVMLFDDTTYSAKVVGYDTRTDIGVLRIEATGLKKAEFGDVKNLEVGQTVYAIGNPGGSEFAGSFTNGMISAIARPVSSKTGYTTKCIQHTAAINPGNSGGALVNEYGQVIGINSMKIVETEYEGMGFAVPADVVKEIVEDLIANGYVPNRAKLGITYRPASAYETYSMVVQIKGLPKGSLVIESISSDSDLQNTDAQKGDMIVAVNGKNLDTTDVLPAIIENASAGDTLTLSMVRINEDYSLSEFTVRVKLVKDMGSAETTEPETTVYSGGFLPNR